jgi:pyruvate dehydrogenase E2 component (dihydrolipoamide acetyltransferase)
MPTPVIMPKFEMAQETGTVARWIKGEGDVVAKGDVLLEVDTDKVTMEVEATAAGILSGITAPAGKVVPIGEPIAYILGPQDKQAPAPSGQAPAKGPAQSPAPTVAPTGPKATPLAERIATANGVDLSGVPGTGPQGRVTREDVENALAKSGNGDQQKASDGKVRAVPAARRLARELNIDLAQVTGTGPEGRIQSSDVQSYRTSHVADQQAVTAASALLPPQAVTPAVAAAQPAAPAEEAQPKTAAAPGLGIAVRRLVPLTNVRRTIAERMTASTREAPQFTVSVDVDMTRAQAFVEDLNVGAGKTGRAGAESRADGSAPKITLTTFLVKACAWALAQYPAANAMFDPAGQIVEWADVNVGVAVAAEQGLLVPVIHNAGQLGIREIAARLAELAGRAREGRLRLEDIQGGTFTLSNLGMFGIDRFEAILNPPQAAILAVGRVAKRAMVTADDQIKVLPMASLTLTADHRVLDGAGGAQFLALIQKVLEHPGILLS